MARTPDWLWAPYGRLRIVPIRRWLRAISFVIVVITAGAYVSPAEAQGTAGAAWFGRDTYAAGAYSGVLST